MMLLKLFCGQMFFAFLLFPSFVFCQNKPVIGYKPYFMGIPLLATANGELILENRITDCRGDSALIEGNPLFLNYQGLIYLKAANGARAKRFGFKFINENKPGTYDNLIFCDDKRVPIVISGSNVFFDKNFNIVLKDGCPLMVGGGRIVMEVNSSISKPDNFSQPLVANNGQVLLPDGRNATVNGEPVSVNSSGYLIVDNQNVKVPRDWYNPIIDDIQIASGSSGLLMVKADGNMAPVIPTPTPEDTTIYKDFDHQHHLWNKIMDNEKFYEGKHLEFLVYMRSGSAGLYDEMRPYWIGALMNTKTGEVYSDTKLQILLTPGHTEVIDKDKKKKVASNEYEIVDVEGQMGYASPNEGFMRIFLDKMIILKKIKIDD